MDELKHPCFDTARDFGVASEPVVTAAADAKASKKSPLNVSFQGAGLTKAQAGKSVIVLTWDAGGGHRASAVAFEQAFRQREQSYQVRIVSLRQIIDETDPGWRAFGDNFYNSVVLRYGLFGLQRSTWPVQLRSRNRPGFKRRATRAFREFFEEHKPDAVVSIVPFYNESFCAGLKAALPAVPYIVIPSDYGSPAYGFWFDASESYYVLGTARLMEEGLAAGISRERLLPAAGLMIHPKYTAPISRKFSVEELGLTAGRMTGLVLYGVHPTRRFVKRILRVCNQIDLPIQLILVCGHDARLRNSCERIRTRYPKVALGFVDNLHELMSASDFCIGKPGPGAITEAMASGLPFIVHTGKKPMVQEVPAADFVRTQGFGLHIHSLRQLKAALETLFVCGQHAEIRHRLNGYRNNAVYDAVDHVKAIVENSRPDDS